MNDEITKPTVIQDTSYFVRINPFVDIIQGKKVQFDYGVTSDSNEELHYIIDGVRYIYEIDSVEHLFYKKPEMTVYGDIKETEHNKHLFDELYTIYEKQNKKYGKWIGEYFNSKIKQNRLNNEY